MRWLALLLFVPLAAAWPVDVQDAEEPEPGAAQRVPDLTNLRGALLAAAHALERAGMGAPGLAAAMEEHDESTTHWRWSRLAGDLDGDGVPDVLRNDVDLETGRVDAHALSGADGSDIWSFEHGTALTLLARQGEPLVRDDGRLQRLPDVDGDGVPDVMVLAMEAQAEVAAGPVESYVIPFAVHALDGRTGTPIWSHTGTATWTALAADPYVLIIDDLPTGWLVHDGPRVVLKTTDVRMSVVYDPTCDITGCLLGWYTRDAEVSDTVTVLDGDGRVTMRREIPASEDPEHTRWTWLSGVAAGPQPRIVLDTLLESRPQASEPLLDPIDGRPMAHYGRGMEMRALDMATGIDAWRTVVFDEIAWRARVPLNEEPYPVLQWTHGDVLADLDGDGTADPVASYLVEELSQPGAPSGRFRTHFVPLSGADGHELLRHTAQGWGFAAAMGRTGWLATGTVDLPTTPAPGGSYPESHVQLAAIDVAQGPVWTLQTPFVQASGLSHELALVQLRGALAMADLDGDGVQEVVSPPQYQKPAGQNQTLASNAGHRYSIHSGASGDVLYEVDAWGRAGFVVPCPLPDQSLVFLSGHGRRVEATRIDIPTGTMQWQHTLLFDERPRPATAPVNVVLWGGACDHLDGHTTISNNLATAFLDPVGSLAVEAPSAVAAVGPDGAAWVDPDSGPRKPTDVLFTVRRAVEEPLWSLQNIALLGGSLLAGILGGSLVLWRRSRPDDGLGKDPLGLHRR